MRVFGTIVIAQPTTMLAITKAELVERGALGAKPVSDNPLWLDVLILQQPPQQPQRGACVTPLLHDHVYPLALVINSAPSQRVRTCDRRDEFIEASVAPAVVFSTED